MRKYILLFGSIFLLSVASCHKSTCPTFDKDAGERSTKGSTGKSRLSIMPKNMQK